MSVSNRLNNVKWRMKTIHIRYVFVFDYLHYYIHYILTHRSHTIYILNALIQTINFSYHLFYENSSNAYGDQYIKKKSIYQVTFLEL